MTEEKDKKTTDSEQSTIEIEHIESRNIISDYISGAVLTGPTSDGFYNLTFYSESFTVKKEIAKSVKSEEKSLEVGTDVYEITTEYIEAKKYREDKAKFLFTKDTLRSLGELLINLR